MNVLKQRPLFSGQLRVGSASIRFGASAVSSENEGTRIARVVQDVQRPAMHEFCPHQFAFVRPPPQPSRKQELFLAEGLDDGASGTTATECVEQESNTVLYLFVRIQNRTSLCVVYQPHRQGTLQFAAASFVQDAAL